MRDKMLPIDYAKLLNNYKIGCILLMYLFLVI